MKRIKRTELLKIVLDTVLAYLSKQKSAKELGDELFQFNLFKRKKRRVFSKCENYWKYEYPGARKVKQWSKTYSWRKMHGLSHIINRMNQFKKRALRFPEDYSKEELVEIIKIQEEIIKKRIGKIKKCDILDIKQSTLSGALSIRRAIYALGIPNSTYYKKSANKSPNDFDILLRKNIFNIWESSRYIFGTGKILIMLKKEYGYDNLNHKRIERICRDLKIKSILTLNNKRNDRKNMTQTHPNLIKGKFSSDKPYVKKYTDVSYFASPHYKHGFIYISAAIDGCGWRVDGESISETNNIELVMNTIKNTVLLNNTIINSDHGYQYTSHEYKDYVTKMSSLLSMGRVGKSLDNRPIEFFWNVLKKEALNNIPYEERTLERVQ